MNRPTAPSSAVATAQRYWSTQLGVPESGGIVADDTAESVHAVCVGGRVFVRLPSAIASRADHLSAEAWLDSSVISDLPLGLRAHARLAYTDRNEFEVRSDAAVIPLRHDDPRVRSFAREVSPAEWEEAGLGRGANLTGWHAIQFDGRLAAIAAYENWDGLLGHVCVATAVDDRGRGHATRAAAASTSRAISEGLVAQWRSSVTNPASHAVGARLGFVDAGEQLVYRSTP